MTDADGSGDEIGDGPGDGAGGGTGDRTGDEPGGDQNRGVRSDDIARLDETTVERIAAGEVVERPASVVKELVENSLDAGAARVEVVVERGGKDLVRVRDDGAGMTEGAVRRAVEQHTTSKIRDADDLDAGVDTFGFRGEALATIGAVSRLAIRTKPPGADAGTELRVDGGEVVAVERTGCPPGTTVEVTDLFYNTPAREKYLKTDRTEFGRVNDVVTKYALAAPDVAVSLEHDGREVFATTGQGDPQATILSVYGREVAGAMVPVEAEPEGPIERIAGYVSDPETNRSSREYVAAFVNGRYVQSAAAREAVVEAYGSQLAPDRYPFAVLDLRVPPGTVDVNVHPRKLEVRFSEEGAIRDAVETAVSEALLSEGLLRSSAPRGRSAPEETEVRPEWPDDGEMADDEGQSADGDAGGERQPADGGAGTAGSAGCSSGQKSDARRQRSLDDRQSGAAVDDQDAAAPDEGTSAGGGDATAGGDGATAGGDGATADGDGATAGGDDSSSGGDGAPTTGNGVPAAGEGGSGAGEPPGDSGRQFDATTQRTLDGKEAGRRRTYDSLPPLRVLGQYDDTYVVAESPGGLVLVDQHAADERVNYERLRERFRGDVTAQSLAEPVTLELTAGEAELYEAYREALARLGFHASPTGERSVEVTTVPALLSDALDPALLRDVLSRALSAGSGEGPVEARADDLLADLACYPSVTGNTSLTTGSVVDLLAALDECENPFACPHGRPVLVAFDDDEIDDRFERDYPGHEGRRS